MKPLNNRFKFLLKIVLITIILIILLVSLWAAYIAYRSDEAPDAGRDAFYASSIVAVPDNQNIAVAISGINAPTRGDIIEHGRFVINTYSKAKSSEISNAIIAKKNEIRLTSNRNELMCWISDLYDNSPAHCADEARIRTLLSENKLLLNRYALIQTLPHSQGVIKNVATILDVNDLLAAEIKLDVKNKKSEAAYAKWINNQRFIDRAIALHGGIVNRGLFVSIYGISLDTLEFMLFESPDMIKQHGDELLTLLEPVGLEKYNIKGMLKIEHQSSQQHVIQMHLASKEIYPEYIANREYRAQLNFLKEAQKNPFNYEESENKLYEQYYYIGGNARTLDWLNPLSSILSKVSVNGVLRGFTFIKSMHSKNSLAKLLNLKIKIHQQNISDAYIQAFLNSAGSEYFNPFTNKPMRWDAVNRVLVCDKPNSDKRPVEVRL